MIWNIEGRFSGEEKREAKDTDTHKPHKHI